MVGTLSGMLDHGVKVQHDEPDGGTAPVHNNMVQHPSMSDMLICYPTLQGGCCTPPVLGQRGWIVRKLTSCRV